MSAAISQRQQTASQSKQRLAPQARRILRSIAVHTLVVLGSVSFALPLVWMISVSLMNTRQAFSFPPEWIPNPIIVDNYAYGFRVFNFLLYFKNTAIIAGLAVFGTVLSSTIVAYSFARLNFWGRDVLFILLLSTMMLPQQVTMIPLYVWYTQLGWVNTFIPLTLPTFFGNPFMIFLLRQFFRTIPTELDDAAKIDGAGYFGILWRICAPLARPAMGVVAIFTFIHNWNDFQLPLIYLQNQHFWTVAIGLLQFRGSTTVNLPALMAMSMVAIVPILVLFFVAQRHLVQGVVMTGLKG